MITINEWERLRKRAILIKEQYPKGTRVQLTHMDDIQAPPIGTLGTVMGVDDIGSIMVLWDTGSTLSVTDADECVRI